MRNILPLTFPEFLELVNVFMLHSKFYSTCKNNQLPKRLVSVTFVKHTLTGLKLPGYSFKNFSKKCLKKKNFF